MSLNASKHHDAEAEVPPAYDSKGENCVADDLPYAVIKLSFFEQQAEGQCGQEDGHKANRKHLRGLCNEVERVVLRDRHLRDSSWLDFLEFFSDYLSLTGVFVLGLFLGTLLGMRIQEIMSCGGVQ